MDRAVSHARGGQRYLTRDRFYLGGYFELLYFLTGEHQKYDKREDVFGRVVRRSNLA